MIKSKKTWSAKSQLELVSIRLAKVAALHVLLTTNNKVQSCKSKEIRLAYEAMTIDQKSKSFSRVHVVFDQKKDNVWLTKINVKEGTQHFPKSYCMNQDSKSCTLRVFFCTFGIMLSQFAAVECKVLIQAGRGSLSRLCFLQHKGELEQMLIP